jgi:hypothetical protein
MDCFAKADNITVRSLSTVSTRLDADNLKKLRAALLT